MIDEFLDLLIHQIKLVHDLILESCHWVLDFDQFFINGVEDLTSCCELLFNTYRFSSCKFVQGVSINLMLIWIKFQVSEFDLNP